MANKPKSEMRKKVLELRAKGLTMWQISQKLGISPQLAAYYSKIIK